MFFKQFTSQLVSCTLGSLSSAAASYAIYASSRQMYSYTENRYHLWQNKLQPTPQNERPEHTKSLS